MKTVLAFALLLCGVIQSASAQAPAVAEKEISFKKQKVNAFTASYINVPESDLKATTEIWMNKNLGGKKSRNSGYEMYTNASWDALDFGAPVTVYYKVDGNRKSSTLTLMVTNRENQFLSSAMQPQAGGKLYTFFNELNDEVASYQRMQKINALNTTLKQQESSLQSLERKSNDLKKQKEKLERALADNEKATGELNNQINITKESLKELSR